MALIYDFLTFGNPRIAPQVEQICKSKAFLPLKWPQNNPNTSCLPFLCIGTWGNPFFKKTIFSWFCCFSQISHHWKKTFLHFFVKVQKVWLGFPNIFPKNAQKIIIFVSDIVFCSQSKGKQFSWLYLPNWRNEAQIPEEKKHFSIFPYHVRILAEFNMFSFIQIYQF